MKKSIKEVLNFKELSEEEKKARGILGRLYGPCASFTVPTRNGRFYSDDLWEKVFDSELVKEAFENGGIFGELDHPDGRTETCSEKIAICMPERPKKDQDGHLIAYFDILDTPNGRIAYALAKYGYKLGISSRGNGEVYEDDDGNESVDPDSYDFTCFDLVITPSVKDARLSMTESLDFNRNTKLKKALAESLDKANEDDRKVMEETLNDLHIVFEKDSNDANRLDTLNESSNQTTKKVTKEVDNTESNILIERLQETIKAKTDLEVEVRALNEKLAVSNAKVDRMSEELKKARSAMLAASSEASKQNDLSKKVSELEESLKQKLSTIESQETTINKLLAEQKSYSDKNSQLTESLTSKDSQIISLNEKLNKASANDSAEINSLNEKLDQLKEKSESEIKSINENLAKEKHLKESYKKLAYETLNRYIESKAVMLGITPNEIKNKLGKTYGLDDVDRICEDYQAYQVNINKLPFNLDRKVKVKITESKNDPLHETNPDDEVDYDFLDAIHY